MAAESSRSNSAADSYVGSLISLTSKSEIRYEGILYNINTDESSIGLRNVRSFGTEGRKKDGPQVMPSEKVYEYILFRGSDIKDLQVKSSPPVQPPMQTTTINSDPAIIQSHYTRPASTSSGLPPPVTGSLTDSLSQNVQPGQPGSTFQGAIPLYQPGGNMGSWGPSPSHPSANGSGLPMPMYWPGYYAPPNGLPQVHQQSLLRPPPGLAMPPAVQQPMQYPTFNPSLPTGASNMPGSNLPEFSLPLLPTSTNPLNSTNTSLPSSLPPAPAITLSLEALPSFMQNKATNSAIPLAPKGANFQSASLLTTSGTDVSTIAPPISNKSIASSTSQYSATSQPIPPILGISNSVQTETAPPSLVTPGQLLQSGQSAVSSALSSQIAHKDVEVVQVTPQKSSQLPVPAATEAQPPILSLPQQSRPVYKSSRPVMKFNEEFDFMAMNEKFNKDEVWGYLGKGNKSNSKEKEGDEIAGEGDHFEEVDAELPKLDVKPVYSKDDFFDTLSSNATDNQSNNGRTKFSDQMKLDTETFGEFSRYRGGRGGRGPSRGGRFRGGYYGRGYGYSGRGRGRNMPSRDY
uniref:DFDF domain-containing protein n=1 Tax=Daucus carota subsp. sativus TaxID=79200 RepID=A0A166ECL1_DAUCS